MPNYGNSRKGHPTTRDSRDLLRQDRCQGNTFEFFLSYKGCFDFMFDTAKVNNTVWTFRKGFDTTILDSLFKQLRAFDQSPDLKRIKDNTVRSGFLLKTENPSFPDLFIKRYKFRGWVEKIKYLILPSKALSEWRKLIEFENKGLVCPQPLAISENRSLGFLQSAHLIIEAITEALPLNEYMEQIAPDQKKKRQLITSLAVLIRQLHDRGIYYRDLHAGNIMIRETDNKGTELFFIDLHRAINFPRLLSWMKVKDLAQFSNSFQTSKTEKLRFLKNYCEGSSFTGESLLSLQDMIHAKSQALEVRRIKSRSKRCLKKSSVFNREITSIEKCFYRRDFGSPAARKAVNHHLLLKASGKGLVLKESLKSFITAQETADGTWLCVKENNFVGMLYALKNFFRKSRAMKSWTAANGMLVRGIETPLPYAVIEKKKRALCYSKFYHYRISQRHGRDQRLYKYIQRSLFKT
jgi:tRNA A-37 threonylcarbamoyl transferase component Bud32